VRLPPAPQAAAWLRAVAGWLTYLNPLFVLEPVGQGGRVESAVLQRVLFSSALWLAGGVLCLELAAWQLRPAYWRQLAQTTRTTASVWRFGRPAISDDPVRWKTCHADGPPWLGPLPVAFGILCVLVLAIGDGLLLSRSARPGSMAADFLLHGLCFLLALSLVVALRCADSISGERERRTWESLLATPLDREEIVQGKLRGVLDAAFPYLAAYVGGMLLFWVVLSDVADLAFLFLLIVTAWFGIRYLAAVGIVTSARSASSWRSLLVTLALGYAGGVALFVAGLFLLSLMASVVFLSCAMPYLVPVFLALAAGVWWVADGIPFWALGGPWSLHYTAANGLLADLDLPLDAVDVPPVSSSYRQPERPPPAAVSEGRPAAPRVSS
jgi:ABC-type transport system involved in multi-copper enzyme maturation permease subunit